LNTVPISQRSKPFGGRLGTVGQSLDQGAAIGIFGFATSRDFFQVQG